MMKNTVAAMHSLGLKGESFGDIMRDFDRLKGVSFTPGKTLSCLSCDAKTPLRKFGKHYLCENCVRSGVSIT